MSHAPTGSTKPPWGLLVVILAATFMQLLDVSIVNVASPDIQRTLGASYGLVQLVLAGYQLGFACSLILAARLGDIFGRRRLFLMGMAVFTIASITCGLSVNIQMLIASRVLQGVGSALMFSQVLALIQVLFQPKDRAAAFGGYGTAIGLGSIMGPLAGGLLIQANLTADPWRAIFLVNVPIGVAAFVIAALRLPESKAEQRPGLDFTGAILSAIGLGLLIYPLSEGRTYGWPAWSLLMLGGAVVVLAVLVMYERRLARAGGDPIFDTRLFADRAFRDGALLNFVFYLGIPSFFFTISIYLQVGQGFSALQAGLTTFAYALGAALVSRRAGGLAKKMGAGVLVMGSVMMTVAMAGLVATAHLAGFAPKMWYFWPGMLLAGLAFGFFVPTVIGAVLANVHLQRAGSASGVLATSQQIGGAVGVAILGIVFFGFISGHAPTSAANAAPALHAQLTSQGIPAGASDAAVARFQHCFVVQSRSVDPTLAPPGCRTAASPAAAQAFTAAGTQANATNFTGAMQVGLGAEVLVFAVTVVLSGLLLAEERRNRGARSQVDAQAGLVGH